MKDKEDTFDLENQKQKKCKEEYKEKEELFIEMRSNSDKTFKQEKILLESEQKCLQKKCEKMYFREVELKGKEETFEEMNKTMLNEMKKIGEASQIFRIGEDETKEDGDISMMKERGSKQLMDSKHFQQ